MENFTQKLVLRKPFISDTGEDTAYLFFRPSWRQSSSNQQSSTGKVVMKMFFHGDTGKIGVGKAICGFIVLLRRWS